ncbi:MAG: nickel-dependent hydrogenase large subunit [Corynebacterium sp.]|nr:nickel-dependent hydrogenase large subunit [Corynebacterium sp.]
MSELTIDVGLDINPFTVTVLEDPATGARRFDLSTFPRVEGLLVGKPVAMMPDATKMLCGICPVSHYLASMQALEKLHGVAEIPATAQLIRRVTHHASTVDTLAIRLPREVAVLAKQAARAVNAVVGVHGHFPQHLVVGGVAAAADRSRADEALAQLTTLQEALAGLPVEATPKDRWTGLSVMLIDATGRLDPLGGTVAVVDENKQIVERFPANEWTAHVVESRPGSVAPRPQVLSRPYRVGPWARGLLGAAEWTIAQQVGVAAEELSSLLAGDRLYGKSLTVTVSSDVVAEVGTGVVDTPRGILVHQYRVDPPTGQVTGALIFTPTAQNELWLAQLLTVASGGDAEALSRAVEVAVRMADPCVSAVNAPAGMMDVHVVPDAQPIRGE